MAQNHIFFRKLPIFLNLFVKNGLKWNSVTIVNQVHLFHLKNKLSSTHHCLAFHKDNQDDLTKKSILIHEKDFYSRKFIPDALIDNKLLQNTKGLVYLSLLFRLEGLVCYSWRIMSELLYLKSSNSVVESLRRIIGPKWAASWLSFFICTWNQKTEFLIMSKYFFQLCLNKE